MLGAKPQTQNTNPTYSKPQPAASWTKTKRAGVERGGGVNFFFFLTSEKTGNLARVIRPLTNQTEAVLPKPLIPQLKGAKSATGSPHFPRAPARSPRRQAASPARGGRGRGPGGRAPQGAAGTRSPRARLARPPPRVGRGRGPISSQVRSRARLRQALCVRRPRPEAGGARSGELCGRRGRAARGSPSAAARWVCPLAPKPAVRGPLPGRLSRPAARKEAALGRSPLPGCVRASERASERGGSGPLVSPPPSPCASTEAFPRLQCLSGLPATLPAASLPRTRSHTHAILTQTPSLPLPRPPPRSAPPSCSTPAAATPRPPRGRREGRGSGGRRAALRLTSRADSRGARRRRAQAAGAGAGAAAARPRESGSRWKDGLKGHSPENRRAVFCGIKEAPGNLKMTGKEMGSERLLSLSSPFGARFPSHFLESQEKAAKIWRAT
ncbi:nascent polypeptide-associated complex subunit alpha, muscle-specific form-like [Talpa occidentalis]|uniref:nascent polypeptide-associated complex subunit alpha, muscle-specific form-like n=1 Tax=Talpa occidentalis TaxID=50954 RepID=UPI00188E6754|nr:nascent polypeptide-associated complex subunit alpha, muscle-specific form-like [Talpa occidentalis]